MDVVYMCDIKGYNFQLQYWLVVVDVYLQYVWLKICQKSFNRYLMTRGKFLKKNSNWQGNWICNSKKTIEQRIWFYDVSRV